MKLKSLIIIIFVMISMIGFTQTKSSLFSKNYSNGMNDMENGKKALEKNNLHKAKKHFEKAIKSFDKTYQAYAYLGIIYAMSKDYNNSLKYFQESLKIFDEYKAHILERKTDYMKEFERKANTAKIELDQHDIQYQGGNATAGESMVNDYKNKVNALKEEIEIDKNLKYDAFFRFKYGNILMVTGNRNIAKQQYLLAVETNPDFKDTYANLSVCYFMDGDCANALKIYNEGKKLGTNFQSKFEQDLLKKCK